MSWQQWVLIAYLALGAVLAVARVGKPRPPIDSEVAAIAVVVCALLIGLVVSIP